MGARWSIRVEKDGYKFRSKLEAQVYSIAKGQKKDLRFEPREAIVPYTIAYRYLPDFVLDNGVLIEVKGHLDQVDRRKMITVKKQRPDLDIRFVFGNSACKISKGGSTYAQWAEKHGFPHAEGSIPIEWFEE